MRVLMCTPEPEEPQPDNPCWWPDSPRPDEEAESLEITRAEYRAALLRLKRAAPQLELCVDALVEGVPADRTNTRRGPCGRGRLPQYPWELDYASHGYCGCNECFDDMDLWRIELVDRYDPELTCNVCAP